MTPQELWRKITKSKIRHIQSTDTYTISYLRRSSDEKKLWATEKRHWNDIKKAMRTKKEGESIEAGTCPDQIYMLAVIPPYLSIAEFMGYLNGKTVR